MKVSICLAAFLTTLVAAVPTPGGDHDGGKPDKEHGGGHHGPPLPLLDSKKLRGLIKERALLQKAQKLLDFSELSGTPRTRVIGSPGHNATVNWVYDTMSKLDDYYSVYIQSFPVVTNSGNVTVNGVLLDAAPMTFTAAGHPIKELVPVTNRGCAAEDYPAAVAGKIALISRGTCTFGSKSLLAGAAGAVGVVIYNNVDGVVQGTLGEAGAYPPTIGISKVDGDAFIAAIAAGTPQVAEIFIELHSVTTYNVVAETLGGDHGNVVHLGGHSDSVSAGPGINDNGSGSIGLLEVALHLTKFWTNNAVRFSWWAAEEEGLLGAIAWVKAQPQAELDKIKLYLNFDMIASPNYVYAIYDGDGSAFNVTGPAGSAQAEHLFEDYFRNIAKVATVPTNFDGRSDYGPFLDAGVACGGLFTGAEGLKTAEEAVLFGGEAGVEYDVNYHAKGDDVKNCNGTAFEVNTKAIAHAVAVLGKSTAVLDVPRKRRGDVQARAKGVKPQRVGGKFTY